MTTQTAILWFRRDLRLADNPALRAAIESDAAVIPIYVHDPHGPFALGGAAEWWLHHSLSSLAEALEKKGCPLVIRSGRGPDEIKKLVKETKAEAVYWNRRYDKHAIADDKALKTDLVNDGVAAHSFNGALLREPWELSTKTGGFYKVFTPFWRALQATGPARNAVLPAPKKLPAPTKPPKGLKIEELKLLPTTPDWAVEFSDYWTPGEKGAARALGAFLKTAVRAYGDDRNRPDREGTSRLSPHLAFGEISPLQVWQETQKAVEEKGGERGAHVFLSEIAWREFAYVLLYHYPDIQTQPIKPAYAHFDWRDDPEGLARWRKGETGFPIIDAGMRQLWRTGWMHNRVRMIVASFLAKNMLVPWQEGERWFWDTLVDADPASNTASWQWVAGSGADAAPYFRIFNPVSQGEKFDPNGDYVRQFVPEIAGLPAKHIHAPFDAPSDVLSKAGVTLGETYPEPMLNLAETRKRALASYDTVKLAS